MLPAENYQPVRLSSMRMSETSPPRGLMLTA